MTEAGDAGGAGPGEGGSESGEGGAGDSGEGWAEWWRAARGEPAFGELLRERDEVFADVQGDGSGLELPVVLGSLRRAGFAEVGLLGQVADKHLVAAIR